MRGYLRSTTIRLLVLSAVLASVVALTLACGDEDESGSVAVLKRAGDQNGGESLWRRLMSSCPT